jgi:hypothetical protein
MQFHIPCLKSHFHILLLRPYQRNHPSQELLAHTQITLSPYLQAHSFTRNLRANKAMLLTGGLLNMMKNKTQENKTFWPLVYRAFAVFLWTLWDILM